MFNGNKNKLICLLLVLTIGLGLCLSACRRDKGPDTDDNGLGRDEQKGQDLSEDKAGEGEKPALPKQLEAKDNTEPKLKVYIAEEKRVKEMAFEDYVAAVVGGEIKNDWPIEAIKAQAIIARTFVLNFIEEKGQSKYGNAHVSTDIEEAQAWDQEAVNESIKKAINDTRGQVIVYKGRFARTWFHSNAGGKTATPVEGLNFKDQAPPYIQVVDSPDMTEAVEADAKSWEASFSKAKVLEALKAAGKPVEDFKSVSIGEKGPSGRAVTIAFDDTKVSAAELRLALGTTDMRSTLLDSISLEGDSIKMSGKGYGHGVGMSQWGAYNMAQNKKTAEDIINHYYKDIDIVKLWD